MLILKDIVKNYAVGDSSVKALRGIDLRFRKSEFVSILGQSGCGKTTLLNIIGGLDRYSSGDLIINGKSTKTFNDGDWDTYRNHSIGFVFQTYNLIPHQTVLSNVELALTLSGVTPHERKRRAIDALTKVGLGDQLYKKPNQMSGGQMQRVAIARALVNDPDILLADEPTGALDSETSVQIMEILKEISRDKLIIMVTHNPDLAAEYSTRIIRLLDGKVVGDSDPYTGEESAPAEMPVKADKATKKSGKGKKKSMSFLTALSLSLNNLMTKKGRTLLTSFAGSIGIIGIALILSVSTGVQNYINQIQQETNASYPIVINKSNVDMSSMIVSIMGENSEGGVKHPTDDGRIYANTVMAELMKNMLDAESNTKENNLEAFKKDFLENNEELDKYASIIQCIYDINFNAYVTDIKGNIVESDVMALMTSMYAGALGNEEAANQMTSMYQGFDVWEEMLADKDGMVHDTLKAQYDLVNGRWPEAYDEILLVVNENNEISDLTLYALGLTVKDDMIADLMPSDKPEGEEEEKEIQSWSFEEIQDIDLRFILSTDYFVPNSDGTYTDMSKTEQGLKILYDTNGTRLKVVGVIKPNEDASAAMLTGSLVYTQALTTHIIKETLASDIVDAQLKNPTVDVITGKEFQTKLTESEKVTLWDEHIAALDDEGKKQLFIKFSSVPDDATLKAMTDEILANYTIETLRNMIVEQIVTETGYDRELINANLTDEMILQYASEAFSEMAKQKYALEVEAQLAPVDAAILAAQFNDLNSTFGDKKKVELYDEYLTDSYSDSTYDENLKLLGYATLDRPKTIKIFADTFENKDKISALIEDYNKGVENEEDQISYTDIVALLMSSVTTIINAISYVLIAFVAISLVVSSIMIGIITYISVLERTKEIGILRAIGASKKDISRVFNAETLIVGFGAGAIGIVITLVLNLIISFIIQTLTGIPTLTATLPFVAALILVGISMALTLIAGLIPSRVAANKDPVVALRTE